MKQNLKDQKLRRTLKNLMSKGLYQEKCRTRSVTDSMVVIHLFTRHILFLNHCDWHTETMSDDTEYIYCCKNVESRVSYSFFALQEEYYLIKWKGWPMTSCTWEHAYHLTPELLR